MEMEESDDTISEIEEFINFISETCDEYYDENQNFTWTDYETVVWRLQSILEYYKRNIVELEVGASIISNLKRDNKLAK